VSDGKKTCTSCGKEKPFDDFPSWIEKGTGSKKMHSWCRRCKYQYKEDWKKRNGDKCKVYADRNREKYKDHARAAKWQQMLVEMRHAKDIRDIKSAICAIRKQIMKRDGLTRCCKCRVLCSVYDVPPSMRHRWHFMCPACYRLHLKRAARKARVRSGEWMHKRRESSIASPAAWMINRLRVRHRTAMRRQGIDRKECAPSTTRLLGCTPAQLCEHVSAQWTQGMGWNNYGRVRRARCWELDHVKPLAKYDLSSERERAEAFHFTNIAPAWRSENRKKSDKIVTLHRQFSIFSPINASGS